MKLPPYDIFPNIYREKITLRQIQLSDIKDIIEISFYDSIKASTVKEATEMQEKIKNDYNQGNSIHWGIAENVSNKIVGTCGYYRGLDKGAGELGCILLPQFRGQGFMTDAMQLAINFGLNNIGLKRIWAITTTENHTAKKLLERLDFIKLRSLPGDEIEYELRGKVQ
ncbi:MAG: GNAT family protein [Bacteroidia bacterium]